MKYRTIEEAKTVVAQMPEFPPSYLEKFHVLANAIRIGNEGSASKLKKIYAFTDLLTAFIAPYMVCEKGCSHCCRIDVLVSTVEAQYIHKNLGFSPRLGNSISTGHSAAKRPCPFLGSDHACSIYEYRPFACRTYHVVDDPTLCEDQKAFHVTYTNKSNGMLNKLFNMVGSVNSNQPIRDIRDFFPNGHET